VENDYKERMKRVERDRQKSNEMVKRSYRLTRGPSARKFKKDGSLFLVDPVVKEESPAELTKEEAETHEN
jgi:hypothetical protein